MFFTLPVFRMKLSVLVALFTISCPLGAGFARADLIGLSSSIPGTLYNVNPQTGVATPTIDLSGDSSAGFVGLASLNGVLYATDINAGGATHFGLIDLKTGDFTALNSQGGSHNWHSLAAIPTTQLLYTVDLSLFGDNWMLLSVTPTGVITQVGPTGIDIRGLAFDPNLDILYGVGFNHVNGGLNLYSVNLATGLASLIGPTGYSNFRPDLAFDPFSNVLYLNFGDGDGGNSLYTVNAATGAATLVGPNGPTAGLGIDGLTFVNGAVPVPEPSSLALFAFVVFPALLLPSVKIACLSRR